MRPRTLVTAAALTALIAVNLPASQAADANLLTGRIIGPDGAPAAGAVVRVSALDPSPPSGSYQDAELGTIVAGPDGRFALPLVLTTQLRSLADFHGGALNLWIHAERPGALPAADLTYARLDGSTLDAPAPLEITLPKLPAGATVPLSHHGCMNYRPVFTVVERTTPFEPVGEIHTGRDMSAYFEYGDQANTDLGGAYQAEAGPWSVSVGTSHMGNKETAVGGERGSHFGKRQLTTFRYRKDRVDWFERGLSGHKPCRTDYRIVPEQWSGVDLIDGEDVSSFDGEQRFNQAPNDYKASYSGGNFFRKHTGRGEKYSAGVQAFGVSLHAQSQWSETVDIKWTFGNEPFLHHLFATDKPLKEAKTIYAW